MATIPGRESLGARPTLRSNGAPSLDGGQADFLRVVGDEAGSAANAVLNFKERNDQFNYARAQNSLLQADIEVRKELEDEDDWENFERNYADKMTQRLGPITEGIRDNDDRAAFSMEGSLAVARGSEAMRETAFKREISFNRSVLDDSIATNRELYLNARDSKTREAIIENNNRLIDGAKANRYLTDEEAVDLRQATTADFAVSFIDMQTSDKQIELLKRKDGPASFLKTDVREKMLQAAQKENETDRVLGTSQARADLIMKEHGSDLTAALAEARNVKGISKDIRAQVERDTVSEVKRRFEERNLAEKIAADDLYQDLYDKIEQGEARFTDLTSDQRKVLRDGQQSSLKQKDLERVSPGRQDDRVWLELMQMSRDELLATKPEDYFPHLDGSHRDAYTKMVTEAREGNDFTHTSAQSFAEKVTALAGGVDERRSEEGQRLVALVDRMVLAKERELGRQLNPEEQNDLLADAAIEVKVGIRSVPLSELKQGQGFDIDINNIPEARRELIADAWRRKYKRNPTNDELKAAYVKAYLGRVSAANPDFDPNAEE